MFVSILTYALEDGHGEGAWYDHTQ